MWSGSGSWQKDFTSKKILWITVSRADWSQLVINTASKNERNVEKRHTSHTSEYQKKGAFHCFQTFPTTPLCEYWFSVVDFNELQVGIHTLHEKHGIEGRKELTLSDATQ